MANRFSGVHLLALRVPPPALKAGHFLPLVAGPEGPGVASNRHKRREKVRWAQRAGSWEPQEVSFQNPGVYDIASWRAPDIGLSLQLEPPGQAWNVRWRPRQLCR